MISPSDPTTPGTIGHDDGLLVLRLDRLVQADPIDVSKAVELVSTEDVRWEVDRVGDAALVTFTAWFDASDPDAAAEIGATCHLGFEQFVRSVANGPITSPPPLPDLETLTARYVEAIAAALADTD